MQEMAFSIVVPGPGGETRMSLELGSSLVFVGANGGGKTRLAVKIEQDFIENSHRIAAHRALNLNPEVDKISEKEARRGLKEGGRTEGYQRIVHRWGRQAAVALLNDFDFLVQAVFAEQNNTAYQNHALGRSGQTNIFNATKLEQLAEIWVRLLPQRKILLSGDSIKVYNKNISNAYSASEMSDGERATFYLIGQALISDAGSLLIFDEPELHIHRSIMNKIWDEIEAARPDCAFVLITHDLDFAATRVGAKYVIRDYSPEQGWTLQAVPEETGFSEDIATLILGSRRPILFTEGTATSLDQAIYRACYPSWTVFPRGSCEVVVHSVTTMRGNNILTRVTCAGLVDSDDYDESEKAALTRLGVAVLPVSEIENLILLPSVSRAIAEHEGYRGAELESKLEALKREIFQLISGPGAVEKVVVEHCRRRIDRILKKIDLSTAGTVSDLAQEYSQKTAALDVTIVASAAEARIRQSIQNNDLPSLLTIYSNKGLVALAASHLKRTTRSQFESWLARMLRNEQAPSINNAIRATLPNVIAL